jgi:hypothetical protein
MNRKNVTTFKIGASLGFLLAVLVLGYGYIEPRIHSPALNDWLILLVCPYSIVLLATDQSRWYAVALADCVVIATNTVWYGVLFMAATSVFLRRRKTSVSARGSQRDG